MQVIQDFASGLNAEEKAKFFKDTAHKKPGKKKSSTSAQTAPTAITTSAPERDSMGARLDGNGEEQHPETIDLDDGTTLEHQGEGLYRNPETGEEYFRDIDTGEITEAAPAA
jgi:hypothetical protein